MLKLAFLLVLLWLTLVNAAIQRRVITNGSGWYVKLEWLRDDIVHVETAAGTAPSSATAIWTSPMVTKTDYSGPNTFTEVSSTLWRTNNLEVSINTGTLQVTFKDLDPNPDVTLTKITPINLNQAWKGFDITKEVTVYAYGLGQQFITVGSADGDWTGRQRLAGETNGNAMTSFNAGSNGNTQLPIFYSKGSSANYALFLDQVYKNEWDLTSGSGPWPVRMWGDQIRFYFLGGPSLANLRQDYMELTGRAPVPPKKMFGLWLSEYGYNDWTEVDSAITDIKNYNMPLDGIVLDLFWFGGVTDCSDNSNMGKLTWDTTKFPNPSSKLASLSNNEGVGVMLIEESYIAKNLAEHATLHSLQHLAYQDAYHINPVYLTSNCWWGKGSMIDWSKAAAGDYWHDNKRQPLINDGVQGHWCDLGEPEMYYSGAYYVGFDPVNFPSKNRQADVHNIYNLRWLESIVRGYQRNNVTQRPFLLSRSGTSGMQRYGAALWSGDIASRLSSLATHLNAQLHLTWAGLDYYGADIGGFHRSAYDNDPASGKSLGELYTQWFANGAMFDLPVRPHVENLCNCKAVSPTSIGHRDSNIDNIRQRYELIPYYYSLAYRAWLYGEPVIAPLIYYYESDYSNLGEMGHQKLIGRDILVGVVAGYDELYRDIYLPAGDWINYHTKEWFKGNNGRWVQKVPVYYQDRFRLPTFVRMGSIVPKMWVDAQTANALGKRRDGSTRPELIIDVTQPLTTTEFTLYEDDGTTNAYQISGSYRTTLVRLEVPATSQVKVTIFAASGTYTNAPSSRPIRIRLTLDDRLASVVTFDGNTLTQYTSLATFEAQTSGWINAGYNTLLAKSGSVNVGSNHNFVVTTQMTSAFASANFVARNGYTRYGCSVYVVGSVTKLGSWDPCQAVKLSTLVAVDGVSFTYPVWSQWVQGLPANTNNIQWKFIRREESNCNVRDWQAGSNNVFNTGNGFAGTSDVNPTWESGNCAP